MVYDPLQQHPSRIFNVVLDLYQELHSFPAIQETVVISQGEVHHGPNHNLTIDNNRFILDGMQPENSSLGEVDDWCAHQGAENPAIADGEGTSSYVLNGELVVTSL